jgi:hypothetical protein
MSIRPIYFGKYLLPAVYLWFDAKGCQKESDILVNTGGAD